MAALTCVLMLPTSSISQESDFGNWLIYIGNKKLNSKWNIHNEVEYRIFNKKKGVLSSTSKLSKIERVNGLSYLYIKDSLVYYKDKLGNRNSFNVKAGKIEPVPVETRHISMANDTIAKLKEGKIKGLVSLIH